MKTLWQLGSGERPWPLIWPDVADWCTYNIDTRDLPHVNLVHDIRDVKGIVAITGRPNRIAAEDVLEHLTRDEAAATILALCDALAPGGEIHIRVPSLDALAIGFCNGEIGTEFLEKRLYGGQGYPQDVHRTGWTTRALWDAVTDTGLHITRSEVRNFNTFLWATKEESTHA